MYEYIKQPKVMIILVNYNGFEDTAECIRSIKQITYLNYEIVVVDNASTQKPDTAIIEYIRKNSVYLESKINLGFSGGNNIGIDYALAHNCDYVLLLNNDTTVTPEFLNYLIDVSENNSNVGIVGGKILLYSNPDMVWYAGGEYNLENGIASHSLYLKHDDNHTDFCKDVTFITGCMMLIPRNIIMEIGGLDEEFFLYAEDTDYCCKIRKANYRMIYCNSSIIYHKVSAATGRNSDLTQYYTVRNEMMLIKRYGNRKIRAYCYHIYRSLKSILKKQKNIAPVGKGYFDFILGRKGKRTI